MATSRDQRAMGLGAVAVVLIVLGAAALDWFTVHGGGASGQYSLHGGAVCTADGACKHGLGPTGLYGDNAMFSMWGCLAFAIFVIVQVGSRMLRGFANPAWTKKGYFWSVTVLGSALTNAYLLVPDLPKVAGIAQDRTWAPVLLTLGVIAGIAATYYATDVSFDDDVGEYKPIVMAKSPAKPTA